MKNLRIKVVGKATMVAMLIGAYHLGAQSSALPASAPQGVHEEHQTGQGLTFHGDVAPCRTQGTGDRFASQQCGLSCKLETNSQ